LEHKAARMNEWYPQRGPRKMGRMSAVIKYSTTLDSRNSLFI